MTTDTTTTPAATESTPDARPDGEALMNEWWALHHEFVAAHHRYGHDDDLLGEKVKPINDREEEVFAALATADFSDPFAVSDALRMLVHELDNFAPDERHLGILRNLQREFARQASTLAAALPIDRAP